MRLQLLLVLIPLLGVESRIFFPEELVSFLSFVYSVIPPFKIGQDSRIGAGFRVGPNADFQILLELGPQSETQPLGPDVASKRDAKAPSSFFGTNRRKSLKNKKHIPQSTEKNTTEIPAETNRSSEVGIDSLTKNFTEVKFERQMRNISDVKFEAQVKDSSQSA